MNGLDIAILVLIAIPTLICLRIGIIKAVLSLVGVVLGIILAGQFYVALSEQLAFISQDNLAKIAAFAIILIGVMLIATVTASLLKLVTSFVMLGWVDHLGGAVLGFATGALLISAVLATLVNLYGTGLITDSVLAGVMLDKFPLILGLLPEEFNAIRDFFQ